jgi:hypothetical protein
MTTYERLLQIISTKNDKHQHLKIKCLKAKYRDGLYEELGADNSLDKTDEEYQVFFEQFPDYPVVDTERVKIRKVELNKLQLACDILENIDILGAYDVLNTVFTNLTSPQQRSDYLMERDKSDDKVLEDYERLKYKTDLTNEEEKDLKGMFYFIKYCFGKDLLEGFYDQLDNAEFSAIYKQGVLIDYCTGEIEFV